MIWLDVAVAGAAAGAAWMIAPRRPGLRVPEATPTPDGDQRLASPIATARKAGRVPGREARSRTRWAASALAAVGVWCLVGGPVGSAMAVVALLAGPPALARLEPAGVRRRRERLTADAPQVADLLAAALASGSTLPGALRTVAQVVEEPAASIVRHATAHLELGAEPGSVWQSLEIERPLAPIARAARRADASGAPLADVLLSVADDLRSRHRAAAEAAARTAGVRAIGPLGACFLPAFVLLGVVPAVASLLPTVSL